MVQCGMNEARQRDFDYGLAEAYWRWRAACERAPESRSSDDGAVPHPLTTCPKLEMVRLHFGRSVWLGRLELDGTFTIRDGVAVDPLGWLPYKSRV